MEPHEIGIHLSRLHILEAGLQNVADTARKPAYEPLKHLDIPMPCSAAPGAVIDETEPCHDRAEWEARIHFCGDGDESGSRLNFWCCHHTAVYLLVAEGLLRNTEGYMPCGHFMPSVWHQVRLVRL